MEPILRIPHVHLIHLCKKSFKTYNRVRFALFPLNHDIADARTNPVLS